MSEDTPLALILKRLFNQKRTLSLFIATQDPGYAILTAGAGKLVKKALRVGKIRLQFIDGADHTFSEFEPRKELIGRLLSHVREFHK